MISVDFRAKLLKTRYFLGTKEAIFSGKPVEDSGYKTTSDSKKNRLFHMCA
jgi:hypothetical protein